VAIIKTGVAPAIQHSFDEPVGIGLRIGHRATTILQVKVNVNGSVWTNMVFTPLLLRFEVLHPCGRTQPGWVICELSTHNVRFVASPTLRLGVAVGYRTNAVFSLGMWESVPQCLSYAGLAIWEPLDWCGREGLRECLTQFGYLASL
jgi:hypothetical protein